MKVIEQGKILEYEEIKDIIKQKLNIVDKDNLQTRMDKYKNYCREFFSGKRLVSKEEEELLSPDNINCTDFWALSQNLFGNDPISHTLFGSLPNQVRHSNIRNLYLANQAGILNYLLDRALFVGNILEIGTGLGSIRNFVLTCCDLKYTGIDLINYLGVGDVIEIKGDGLCLEKMFRENKFDIVVCHNTFQHLSIKQQQSYLENIPKIMSKEGSFIVNTPLTIENPTALTLYIRNKEGKQFITQYGQFTAVPTEEEFLLMLKNHGFRIAREVKSSFFKTFYCRLA